MRVAILRRSVACAALAIAVAATGHPLAAQAAPDVGPAGRPSGPTPGIGEGFVVRAGNLDGRPGDEIVVGSRRVAAFDQRSLTDRRPIWTFQWPNDPDNPYGAADNEWVTDIAMVDGTGDKVPDVLLTTSRGEIYLLNGRNGKPIWQQDAEVGTWSHLAVIDADADGVPDFFATGGLTARSGRTGQPLWRADAIPRTTHWAVTAELDGKPGRDVLIAYERPGIIPPPGGGGGGDPTDGPPEVFAYTGRGELLWSARPIERIFSLATADANGDGIDEAVVGMDHGQLAIIDQRGERWRTTVGSDPVRSLVTVEAAGGGLPTFAATTADANPGFAVVDADGVVTGQVTTAYPVHQLATRTTGAATQVLASTRAETWLSPGYVYAFDLAAGTEPLWRAPTTGQVESLTTARVAGEDLVVYGSQDAVVRGVSGATGKPAFTYLTGGFMQSLAAGNVDGRPGDEIATIDGFGSVAVQRRDGVSVGSYDLLDDAGAGQDVAVADVDGDGVAEVAASGYLFSAEHPGVVSLYGAGGQRWTTRLAGWAQSLALADVDGVPGKEVVVGEVTVVGWLGGPSYVTVLDGRTGEVKWRTQLGFSFQVLVEAADVDRDGRAEIAFSDINVATQPVVALLGGDGKVRWRIAEMPNGGWLTLSEHGVTAGGSGQNEGTVTRYRLTDGAVDWRTMLPGVGGRSGASTFGALVPDVTGDGVPEVAGSSQAGIVRLLDGATGAVRFATALDAPDGHLWAGPITVVRPNPGRAPRLVVGQASSWRSPARIFSLSLDGTVLQSWETTGEAWAAVTVRLPGNKEEAAVAAGLSVYLRGVS